MNKKDLKQLNNLPYFTKETLRSISDVSDNALSKNISRWTKEGALIRLKNGVYVTREGFRENTRKGGYTELISNVLCSPSYLSLEYVLSLHEVITESPQAVTAITTKSGREYNNKLGRFTYRSINRSLFIGYETQGARGYQVATKSKALFDYLYLKTDSLSLGDRNLVEELRLDLSPFSKEELSQLRRFAETASKPSTTKLIEKIIKDASD